MRGGGRDNNPSNPFDEIEWIEDRVDRGGERKKGKEKDGNRKRKIKREIEGGYGERKKERERNTF